MRQALCIGVCLIAFAAAGNGAILSFYGNLNGPNENPPVPSSGTGFALVTYDSIAQTLEVDVRFSDLTGTTTVAHVHCCVDPPGNVGVATFPGTFPGFPAGLMSGSYNGVIDLTQTSSYTDGFLAANGGTAAGAEAGLLAGLQAGRAYLNVHSTFATGGEIRDFLAPVPEPSTSALLACALAALASLRFRRSRHTTG